MNYVHPPRMSELMVSAILASVMLLPCTYAIALPYQIVMIDTLGGAYNSASAINDSGEIVGVSTTTASGDISHAFVYRGGVVIDLGTLGGVSSSATAVNANGQIAGYAQTATGVYHAFRVTNGVMEDLGTLGSNPATSNSFAYGINVQGQVVGHSYPDAGGTHAFLYSAGSMLDLSPSAGVTLAFDINDAGAIAGNGVGGIYGGISINNFGQTAGFGGQHAFVFSSGVFTDLRTLGGRSSAASDINDSGTVVGYAQTALGAYRAFIWSDAGMTDLNDLLPIGTDWTLNVADGINSGGYIVGTGTYLGQSRAFLMCPPSEPCPLTRVLSEPPTGALVLVGAGTLLGLARRRLRAAPRQGSSR